MCDNSRMIHPPDAVPSSLFSRNEWRRQAALWVGALLVAVAAILSHKAANAAGGPC